MRQEEQTRQSIGSWAAAAVFMLLVGTLLGFVLMVLFNAVYWGIELVWITGAAVADTPVYPLIICVVAGICLSIVVWYNDVHKPHTPQPEGEEKTSRSLPTMLAEFVLPILGGGPVGVAMGIVGLARKGCSWVKRSTIALCVRLKVLDPEADFSKQQKIVLYSFGAVGGILGSNLAIQLTGIAMMIPALDAAPVPESLLPGILFALLGWVLGLYYLVCAKLAKKVAERSGTKKWILPLISGVVLGGTMIVFPHVGLPGSDAYSYGLMETWTALAPAVLLATALLRTGFTAFLLNFGWKGGAFLPLLYSAICLGFGLAGIFGLDAAACATGAICGVLVCYSGNPTMGVIALVCCPLQSVPLIIVATVIAAVLPRPKSLGEAPQFGLTARLRNRKKGAGETK